MKSILIVNNYDSFVFNLVQMVETAGGVSYDMCYNDQIPFSRIGRYDGLLLSPGPGVPETAGDMLALINATQHTHSILGVCLGHQALAVAFGGTLWRLSQPQHGLQTTPQILCRRGIWANVSEKPLVGHYHSWSVDARTLPSVFQITAVDEQGNILSIEHKTRPIFGVQFHPESYMSNVGTAMLNHWINTL